MKLLASICCGNDWAEREFDDAGTAHRWLRDQCSASRCSVSVFEHWFTIDSENLKQWGTDNHWASIRQKATE